MVPSPLQGVLWGSILRFNAFLWRGRYIHPIKKRGIIAPPKRRKSKGVAPLYISLSGSPVAIDVKMDSNAVVADIPIIVGQSIQTILIASVPTSATTLWQNVLNALMKADFQNDFVMFPSYYLTGNFFNVPLSPYSRRTRPFPSNAIYALYSSMMSLYSSASM